MQVFVDNNLNVLTRLIENYPEIEAMAKLMLISKGVNHLVMSNVNHLIVPSYSQGGKRCLLKPEFLRKFPNLKQVYANKNIPHGVKDETVGCHVLLEGAIPEIKGLWNIHIKADAKIDSFLWYVKDDNWENEDRHLRNISLLQLFVNLCKGCKGEFRGVSYVVMTEGGIFSMSNPYNGEVCGDQMMAYSMLDKTFHNGDFVPYDFEDDIDALVTDDDADDESLDVEIQVHARYERYLKVLSQIEIKNMNDMCFRFIYDIASDLETIRLFKDLEGIVCVDFYNDEDACIVEDLADMFSSQYNEVGREFLKPIKHYYLLSYDKGFVSYINDATLRGCETLATVISGTSGGQPLTQVLTFPDVDEGYIEYAREIFPNADVKQR